MLRGERHDLRLAEDHDRVSADGGRRVEEVVDDRLPLGLQEEQYRCEKVTVKSHLTIFPGFSVLTLGLDRVSVLQGVPYLP